VKTSPMHLFCSQFQIEINQLSIDLIELKAFDTCIKYCKYVPPPPLMKKILF